MAPSNDDNRSDDTNDTAGLPQGAPADRGEVGRSSHSRTDQEYADHDDPESDDDDDDDESDDGDDDGDDDDDDDGLAPEAGRQRPSLLSLLLLVAGAIWIIVALLKIGDGPSAELPSAAIGDHAAETDAGPLAQLPSLDDEFGADSAAESTADPPNGDQESSIWSFAKELGVPLAQNSQLPSETPNSAENGGVANDPELTIVPEVGTPASERGPPEGSLLAGKLWPRDYPAPEVVHYTIKRGGSMKVVANLFKIFHHEIEALNPGVSLERELPPATKLVVYRYAPGSISTSIGVAGAGSIEGAMPMVDGPGRILKHTPWKGWATRTTVATLDMILREWARRFPKRQPILVGNMSARNGGRLKPHSSHQSGRDVDLSYPQIWDQKEELNWRTMSSDNLDRELTWALLELLHESGAVEAIFIETKLQKLLHEHALETGRYDLKQLKNWMEYPRSPGAGEPLIQHVRGHDDHIHVRFKCTPSDARCESRSR